MLRCLRAAWQGPHYPASTGSGGSVPLATTQRCSSTCFCPWKTLPCMPGSVFSVGGPTLPSNLADRRTRPACRAGRCKLQFRQVEQMSLGVHLNAKMIDAHVARHSWKSVTPQDALPQAKTGTKLPRLLPALPAGCHGQEPGLHSRDVPQGPILESFCPLAPQGSQQGQSGQHG